ncbi:MAG: hypothetical protein ACW987_20025, partial [Candidatus Thorarchaeota archaeon]
MDRISIKQWISNFDAGLYDGRDCSTQCDAGWYDWFCQDKSLRNRLYAMAPKVKQIAASSKVDTDKLYVFFKNNCPLYGTLYDDFRFCDMETGDVVFTITPRAGYTKTIKGKHAQVWGRENEFDGALIEGTWRDVR